MLHSTVREALVERPGFATQRTGQDGTDATMAHKKGQGSSRNGRDSNPKMLGIKLYGGQLAMPGNIICRQRGTKWHPGKNVGVGNDWTIYSMIIGTVLFDRGGRRINVVPFPELATELEAKLAGAEGQPALQTV